MTTEEQELSDVEVRECEKLPEGYSLTSKGIIIVGGYYVWVYNEGWVQPNPDSKDCLLDHFKKLREEKLK